MVLLLILCLSPSVLAGTPSGIIGYNGFNGSVLIDGQSWQGWMDGQQRFYMARYGYIYRWDFGTGNFTLPATLEHPTMRLACENLGTAGTLVYRVPGRLFMNDAYDSHGLSEIDMETLECVKVSPSQKVLNYPKGGSYGMALDPLSKDLIIGSDTTFWRIKLNSTKFGTVLNISVHYEGKDEGYDFHCDGIVIGPDGKIFFAQTGGGHRVGVISATNNGTATLLRNQLIHLDGQDYSPDGMGISSDGGSLLINTNEGRLLLVDLTNESWPYMDTVLIRPPGGKSVYGDVGQVGADGCAYFSELTQAFTFKVTPCIFSSSSANFVGEECAYDSDCTSGNCTNGICSSVNEHHICQVDSDCNTNYCNNHTCQLAPVDFNCTASRYCSSNNCSSHGICLRNIVTGFCRVDSDCTSFNCDEANGICKPVPVTFACMLNTDCTSRSCVSGTCRYVPTGSYCTSDGDCTSGNCTANICRIVRPVHGCQLDADCSSKSCVNATCVVVPVSHACTYNDDCTSHNCGPTSQTCHANTANGYCTVDGDCNGGVCEVGNHSCKVSPLSGLCVIDTDCKSPAQCNDRKCKVLTTLNILNLPQVTGPDNCYALPSEEGTATHTIEIKVLAQNAPLATGTVRLTEVSVGPVGVVTNIAVGSNVASVNIPWSSKLKLGVHNIQITYSGDDFHFGKNWTVNIVYFYFPTAGRFAISDTVQVGTLAYFYGAQWQQYNFEIPSTESGGKYYVGYRAPSITPNDKMKCGFAQSVGDVDDNTAVPSYAWLGVPMVTASAVKPGTARGTSTFGIIKVNPNQLPLGNTGVKGQPTGGSVGTGNLYGTFCPLPGDGGANGNFLK